MEPARGLDRAPVPFQAFGRAQERSQFTSSISFGG